MTAWGIVLDLVVNFLIGIGCALAMSIAVVPLCMVLLARRALLREQAEMLGKAIALAKQAGCFLPDDEEDASHFGVNAVDVSRLQEEATAEIPREPPIANSCAAGAVAGSASGGGAGSHR